MPTLDTCQIWVSLRKISYAKHTSQALKPDQYETLEETLFTTTCMLQLVHANAIRDKTKCGEFLKILVVVLCEQLATKNLCLTTKMICLCVFSPQVALDKLQWVVVMDKFFLL